MTADPRTGPLERAEAIALRIPFTLATLAMVSLAGWLTNTAAGVSPSARTVARLGFAPADTPSFDIVTAVMSAFVTNGPAAFWTALFAIAALAGAVEWRSGSLRAAIAFWGSHLVTIVLSWLLLAPLHLAGSTVGSLLFLARDVGPSAGYVGCLGYVLAGLPARTRAVALAVGVIALAGLLAGALPGVSADPAGVSAALTHLIALPVGFVLGVLTPKRPLPASAEEA